MSQRVREARFNAFVRTLGKINGVSSAMKESQIKGPESDQVSRKSKYHDAVDALDDVVAQRSLSAVNSDRFEVQYDLETKQDVRENIPQNQQHSMLNSTTVSRDSGNLLDTNSGLFIQRSPNVFSQVGPVEKRSIVTKGASLEVNSSQPKGSSAVSEQSTSPRNIATDIMEQVEQVDKKISLSSFTKQELPNNTNINTVNSSNSVHLPAVVNTSNPDIDSTVEIGRLRLEAQQSQIHSEIYNTELLKGCLKSLNYVSKLESHTMKGRHMCGSQLVLKLLADTKNSLEDLKLKLVGKSFVVNYHIDAFDINDKGNDKQPLKTSNTIPQLIQSRDNNHHNTRKDDIDKANNGNVMLSVEFQQQTLELVRLKQLIPQYRLEILR